MGAQYKSNWTYVRANKLYRIKHKFKLKVKFLIYLDRKSTDRNLINRLRQNTFKETAPLPSLFYLWLIKKNIFFKL